MIAMAYRSHLNHMDLKNWAASLFLSGGVLNSYGLSNWRATPSIAEEQDYWTPDLIAWNNKIFLIIECKAGDPDERDVEQAKEYVNIPKGATERQTGLSGLLPKVALLYFRDKLQSNHELTERILSRLSLERDLVLWSCEPGIQITGVYGDHGDKQLDSLLGGGLPLPRSPPQQIEIQPDSPTNLLARLVFRKLWERSFRFKDTRFTVGTVREILQNDNYSHEKDKNRRLLDAIKVGEKYELCFAERQNELWRLNVILENPASIQMFLQKLREIITYPRLNEFASA